VTETAALALLAAGAAGGAAGAWLSWGATFRRPLATRIAWAVVATVMGASFALGLPASCIDVSRGVGETESTERSSGRWP